MASQRKGRVQAHILDADRDIMFTLETLSDYSPTNPAASLAALRQLAEAMKDAEEAKAIARRYYELAIEQAIAAQAAFHRAVLIAKEQVIAQYGSDSPAVHAVGRKQTSERKRPRRRTASDNGQSPS